MGKRKEKQSTKRDMSPKMSNGCAKINKAKKLLMRIKMKIKRFKRYQDESPIIAKRSKRKGWSTEGLENHQKFLENFINLYSKKQY